MTELIISRDTIRAIKSVHNYPHYSHALLLLKNFLDDHSQMLGYKIRSSKQYHSVVQQIITQILQDYHLFDALEAGTLEIWLSEDKKKVTLKVGE